MVKIEKLLPAMLQAFNDGGDAGDGGGVAGSFGGADSGQSAGTGDETTVLYGKQLGQEDGTDDGNGSDAGSDNQQDPKDKKETQKERMARYRAMVVDGEFKDLYQQETQRMIDRRFKHTKGLEEQIASQQPILDQLAQRYGTTPGDMAALQNAINNDSAMWEAAAEDAGMTVEQYKQVEALKRQNASLMRFQQQRQAEIAAQRQLQQWQQEAEELKQLYPDFDLEEFASDPQNVEYLRHHVPMQMVYEYSHRDAIMADNARQVQKSVVDNIRAKGMRPRENGASSQPGVTVKDKVEDLTDQDIDEIMRRVARGERISF